MAEGIYYYDETAPITRSHKDVLHYQRLDQEPATYLVELPGTLPLPPPELQTRDTRRGTSIVHMDRPTSEGSEQDEPLETYVRTNLPSFRKSLIPDDLKYVRRAREDAFGSVLVDSKLEESRLTPTNVNTKDKEIQMTPPIENAVDKEMRKTRPNKKPAGKGRRNASPNEKAAYKEIQKTSPHEKPADKEIQKTLPNEKPADKEIRKTPPNEKAADKEIRKGHETASFEPHSLTNGKLKATNAVNERDMNQSNNYITAMPMLTDQRGPMAIKVDKDFQESRVKVHLMVDLLDNGKFEESRDDHNVRDKLNKTGGPVHNDIGYSSSSSNQNTKEGERGYGGGRERQRPNRRSWSANNRRESIDRDHRFGKPSFNSYYDNAKENSRSNKIGNGTRVCDGQKCNRRSRSASIMNYSDDMSLSQSTTHAINNPERYSNDNRMSNTFQGLGKNANKSPIDESSRGRSSQNYRKGNIRLSGGQDRDHSPRKNNLGNLLYTNDGINGGREYGGYDGKRNDRNGESAAKKDYKDQSSIRNTTGKPFSYNGMINCDIKDCPCLCHPDYDHSDKQKIGRGLDGRSPYDRDVSKDKRGEPTSGRYDPDKGKGYDPLYDGDLDFRGRPKDGRDRGYQDRPRGKGYDPLYDGNLDGKGRPNDGRDRDYPDRSRGKGYDPLYDGDLDGKGRPKDGRDRDYPDRSRGKGYDPLYDGDLDDKGRPKDGRDRDYPDRSRGKGYDPLYDGNLDGKGRPNDGRDRDYPDRSRGKGYAPLYDGDPYGKGMPRNGRDRDYPDESRGKGYDPLYDGGLDGKGRPKDGRDRDYPDRSRGKGYDGPFYDRDMDGKGWPTSAKDNYGPDEYGDRTPYGNESPDRRARRGAEGPDMGDKRDRQFNDYDDTKPGKTKRTSSPDVGPFGKTVGFRPGDRSPPRRDSTPGDGSRGDDDEGGRGVLKQRVPKSATTLFTHRRYHIQIPDHNLKEPWFNARFALDNEKDVDLKYQGPVKITNYYTSNRYE